ncbi:MAG: hypothetical protein MZU91_13120 [Desulfosudis oleivorans]|nr:hypothetical protein [Desulfosudis oleivorans]
MVLACPWCSKMFDSKQKKGGGGRGPAQRPCGLHHPAPGQLAMGIEPSKLGLGLSQSPVVKLLGEDGGGVHERGWRVRRCHCGINIASKVDIDDPCDPILRPLRALHWQRTTSTCAPTRGPQLIQSSVKEHEALKLSS